MSAIFNYMKTNPVKSGLIGIGVTMGLGLIGYKLYQSRYQQLQGPHWERNVTGNQFFNAITTAKANNAYGAFVHAYSKEEYEKGDMELFLLNDGQNKGMGGVAVKEDGDIVSVFKHPDCKVSGIVGKYLLPKALEHGGNHLDCFNYKGGLPGMYAQMGFVPVSKVKFEDEFAPEDWNYEHGRPDIVFMVHDSSVEQVKHIDSKEITKQTLKQIDELEYSENYDVAHEVQMSCLSN